MWCATSIETPTGTLDFPLPDTILPCNFENSSGLKYEADEVRKCLKEGNYFVPILNVNCVDCFVNMSQSRQIQ